MNGGIVTLNNSTLSNDTAAGGHGGHAGVSSSSSGRVVFGIGGSGQGGGIAINGGSVTLSNCTLSSDTAKAGNGGNGHDGGPGGNGQGGGIAVLGGGCTLNNSTLSDDTAQGGNGGNGSVSGGIAGPGGAGGAGLGGGIYVNSGTMTVTLTNCTLASDTAGGGTGGSGGVSHSIEIAPGAGGNGGNGIGGGVGLGGGFGLGGNVMLTNCTVSQNTAQAGSFGNGVPSPDHSITLGSGIGGEGGNATLTNAIVAGNSFGLDIGGVSRSGTNNLIGGNPLLATLGNYGGPTQTMALLPGSPAINAGTSGAGIPTTDQRGVSRPQDAPVDIGAFQSQGFTLTYSAGSSQTTQVHSSFTNPLLVTVTANNSVEPFAGGVVTYTGPSSGAGIAPNPSQATISAGGQASLTATANTIAGSYTVTASVAGVATSASFDLTNTPGNPASIPVVSGSNQSATVAVGFTNPLVVEVEDQYSNPVPNVMVTFTAPARRASANLSDSSATTANNGQAQVSAAANMIAGGYTVTASVVGVATSASFDLTNTPGNPVSVTVIFGSNQSATVATGFTNPLVVLVLDEFDNAVPDVMVTFTAPTTGTRPRSPAPPPPPGPTAKPRSRPQPTRRPALTR